MERKKRSRIWQLDKVEIEQLINNCSTMSEVLSHFGLQNKGGNFRTFKQRCQKDNINCSKFSGNFGKGALKPRILLEEILVENSAYSRSSLKKRLFKNGMLKNECYCCGLKSEWDNKPLTLQLDHKNGIPDDNRLENLWILCPNCHSQTTTFAGRSSFTS